MRHRLLADGPEPTGDGHWQRMVTVAEELGVRGPSQRRLLCVQGGPYHDTQWSAAAGSLDGHGRSRSSDRLHCLGQSEWSAWNLGCSAAPRVSASCSAAVVARARGNSAPSSVQSRQPRGFMPHRRRSPRAVGALGSTRIEGTRPPHGLLESRLVGLMGQVLGRNALTACGAPLRVEDRAEAPSPVLPVVCRRAMLTQPVWPRHPP
jgi:hypothetical protein